MIEITAQQKCSKDCDCKTCTTEKQNRLKYINERGLKSTFTKWLQTLK